MIDIYVITTSGSPVKIDVCSTGVAEAGIAYADWKLRESRLSYPAYTGEDMLAFTQTSWKKKRSQELLIRGRTKTERLFLVVAKLSNKTVAYSSVFVTNESQQWPPLPELSPDNWRGTTIQTSLSPFMPGKPCQARYYWKPFISLTPISASKFTHTELLYTPEEYTRVNAALVRTGTRTKIKVSALTTQGSPVGFCAEGKVTERKLMLKRLKLTGAIPQQTPSYFVGVDIRTICMEKYK